MMRDVMESFSGAAALAIRQARSYAQRLRDIAALEEINEVILEADLDGVLELVAGKASELTSADHCVLRLVDPSGSR